MPIKIAVRHLVHDDADACRELLEGATEEERYFRFFHPVREVDAALIEPLVDLPAGMLALLAEDGTGRPLGAAHAVLESDGRQAEIAVLVAHGAQGRGVGKSLVAQLIEELTAMGCETVIARSLSGNSNFAHLARSVGMHVCGHGLGVVTWELPLGPAGAVAV